MTKKLNEDTSFNLSIKTIIAVCLGIGSLISLYFVLKADIAEAKILPKPQITRIEYELKDKIIRETILNTQEDVNDIQETLERIEDKVYER